MKTRSISLLLLGLGSAAPALAADDLGQRIAAQGNGKGAMACATCHQADGAGQAAAGFPRLAGLNAGYLADQLQAFKEGTRKNAIMEGVAKALSGSEMQAVAAYYSAQKAPIAPVQAAAEQVKLGEKLATVGDWRQRNLPACVQCHGASGKGVGANFPALTGQHASYIQSQLDAWKQGTRNNDPVGLMKAVADKLSPAEAKAVAAYFASLPALASEAASAQLSAK